MNIKETVVKILSSRVDVTKINENDPLTVLGLDSLDLVEIMLEIEEAVGVEFDGEEIAKLKTLGDVLKAIEEKL
jgi:acyl carrier protein